MPDEAPEGRQLLWLDETSSEIGQAGGVPAQFFVMTAESPCPYLPGQWERKLVTELHGPEAEMHNSRLSRAGFRRSHYYAYRPACRSCRACVPVRIVTGPFRHSKSQRRTWQRNADLLATLREPIATREQYELFRHYLLSRHADGEMATMTWDDYRRMVEETAVRSLLVEFRDAAGSLVAACLADCLDDGISAVYSFFRTDEPARGLGNYCILWLAEECRRRELPYLYLGYWIAGSPKMAYKARFHSLEILSSGGWQAAERGQANET